MNSCRCPASSLTSVDFAHGVVMQRCRSHELQSWTVDGRPTDARTVRSLLKDLFVETRGQRRATATGPAPSPAPKVVDLDVPSQPTGPSEAALAGSTDDQLTALLNARGLQGSWAIA